jgi:hypothetical protein
VPRAGGAERLAEGLGDHQAGGVPQRLCNGQHRHRDHGDRVPGDRERPVLAGAIRQPAAEPPKRQRDRFTKPGDEIDQRGAGPEGRQIWAGDRPGTLVDEVGEHADHREGDHEPRRRQPLRASLQPPIHRLRIRASHATSVTLPIGP